MAQIINTNISSLNAQRNLNSSQSALATSLQRLSSGLRINSSKDDAAGLAISERMSTQINGLNQAARNANDGISLAQTGESAINEITQNLQNIRRLAVQAANATNNAADRLALDREVQQRLAEIDRSATQTSFNGRKILDGSFGNAAFQVGANVGETINVGLATSMRTTSIGKTADYVGGANLYNSTLAVGQQGAGVTAAALTADNLTLRVGEGTAVNVGASAAGSAAGQNIGSAWAKAAAINAAAGGSVTAIADTTVQLAWTGVAAGSGYNLTVNSQAIFTQASAAGVAITGAQAAEAINANASITGVVASFDSSANRMTLTSSEGRDIAITQNGITTHATGLGALAGTNNSSNVTVGSAATATANTPVSVTYTGSIRLVSTESITLGDAGATTLGFTTTSYAVGASALNTASVTTVEKANETISRIDSALATVSNLRSDFGAIQNRFESVITSLQATSENLSAARSRIQDADFAAETAQLTRNQILQQAGVAMLSQANALPQNVLSLLK